MDDVKIKTAYMDAIYGDTLETTTYKVTFVTEEGMNVEFVLSDKAITDFVISIGGVAMQVRARLGGRDEGHDHFH